YTTRTPERAGTRPYRTWLMSVDPWESSCDCPDFVRNGLGICKHGFAILEDLYGSERKLAQTRNEGHTRPTSPLAWDPIRPLTGRGDWLERVLWIDSNADPNPAERKARALFDRPTGRMKKVFADDPKARSKLVETLARAIGNVGAEPALEKLVRREQDRLAAALRSSRALQKKWFRGLERELYPYQREGVEKFIRSGRLLLGDDMGLGKTTQAIASCHALFRAKLIRRGLVIVPASLKWQWEREWRATTDAPIGVVEGSPEERRARYEALDRGFLILNYELLLRDAPSLRELNADLVVLDEAQRIKNWATKTASAVKALRAPYRLVLTGTPLENRLEELASIYDWVDDLALEPKWRLNPHHLLTHGAGGQGEVAGARNLDTLRARMEPTFLRRVRRNVLRQLPPRTETRVPVSMTPEQFDAHSELDQPIVKLAAISKRRPLRQEEFLRLMSLLTKQRMICNGLAQHEFDSFWPDLPEAGPRSEAQLRGLFAPKLIELRRILEELVVDQRRKVIIFSQWRRMLRLAEWAIRDVLGEVGQRAVFFTGAESLAQRTRGVVELHDDPATTVMFLSDAGGVGLNLQRAASACINLELPWNPAVLEQRIGRIYRLGQSEPVEIYNLVCEVGIEARIQQLVTTKQELFSGLFDGTSDEIMYSGAASGMAQIQQLVGEEKAEDVAAEATSDADWGEGDLFEEEDETTGNDTHVPRPASPVPPSAPAGASAAPPQTRVSAPDAAAAVNPASVGQLLGSLSVRGTADGGLVLEAPAESAHALAELFSGMADLLRRSDVRSG
ncbi:MAG: DEAD/DEAH box helicase, partial [Myxococcota bacterium]